MPTGDETCFQELINIYIKTRKASKDEFSTTTWVKCRCPENSSDSSQSVGVANSDGDGGFSV